MDAFRRYGRGVSKADRGSHRFLLTKRTPGVLTAAGALTLLAATCAAGLSLVGATPAHATDNPANVTRFTDTSTETFEGALPECFLPDLVGTNVATETVTGQSVETSSGVFHVSGTDVFAYRVDFPNGMYSYGTSTSHFSFTANGPLTVFTQGGQEPRTIYASDGTPVAQVVLHGGSHITYRDLNGDGVPQADEISANVDRFFFTCH